MDKQQARKIIRETFENTFDKGQFCKFVSNLLNHIEDAPFTYQGNYIPDTYKQYIKTLERIGKFHNAENSLDILIITLQKETSLERARTMQRNFVAWYLNGSRGGKMKDAALVAYVSPNQADWRFSLVRMDYTFEKSKTGKIKVKEKFTPARRWSFLVGQNEKSHTAQSRLVNILADDEQTPTLAELENAFDIETVTKEFFRKYRELFLRTKEALDEVVEKDQKIKADFDAKGVDTVNFAKKLLGQIVFLYFLQKKGWFGVGRDADWGTGSKHFLRSLFDKQHGDYQNFFNNILEPLFYEALRIDRSHNDDYYSPFNCKIPFLNGGLFDPIGDYDWVHTDIHLPDDLFSNSRKTKEGDEGDGILNVFDSYNFTVCEDEPLEKEVAIDPELLGKAYEKFNAIRPDNFDEFTKALKSGKKGEENKFNKKFGVYYTPREIVHYMCKQSLINHLFTRVEEAKLSDVIQRQDMEDLIEVGEMIAEHEATALIKKEKIKNGIQESTEYTALLSDGIRENAAVIDKWLADITVCDPALGSGAFPVGMMNEIVRARNVLSVFLNNQERSDYEFKRRCIEHSLYGVDIDPGAVEIAKLRLWLSLVVDEEDIKNIKPLPNLDYKVVCGNSLLGVEKDLFNNQLFDELEELKPLLFSEANPSKKQEYKEQIDGLISQITNGHTEFDFEVYFSEVFHAKGGFDVVIANPPYGRYAAIPKAFKKRMQDKGIYGKTSDLAEFFIKKTVKYLTKSVGVNTFIVPKGLSYVTSWQEIREMFLNEYELVNLIDTGKAFENVLYEMMIYMVLRRKPKNKFLKTGYLQTNNVQEIRTSKDVLNATTFYFGVSKKYFKILEKIQHQSCPVSKLMDFWYGKGGMTPNVNKKGSGIKVLTGKEIQRYFIKDIGDKKWCLEQKYLSNKDLIRSNKNKVVVQDIVAHIKNPFPHIKISATIDSDERFCLNTVMCFAEKSEMKNEFLLGLLNSNFISFYYYYFIYNQAIRTMHFMPGYADLLPIHNNWKSYEDHIIERVNQILEITHTEDYLQNPTKQAQVKKYEGQIDQLVYQLYGLTDEEIKIVEGETK